MTLVQIAKDLMILAETFENNYGLGFETSQPVSMAGASVVKLSGTLLTTFVQNNERLRWEIQGSNNLWRWHFVAGNNLGASVPSPFTSSGEIAVPYAYVRIRWLIIPPALGSMVIGGSYFIVTA